MNNHRGELQNKQGVALTGRNTTGTPSRAASGVLRCTCAVMECYRRRQTTDDDNRRQQTMTTRQTTTDASEHR